MDPLTIAAASGMRARMESLDMLANNLANADTTGYKADREFYDLYTGADAENWDNSGKLPLIEKPWVDFSQGNVVATSNPLDLAFTGSGFLTVQGPSGNLYTRNGSLKLGTDGTLQTKDGYPVLSNLNKTVQVDPALPFTISEDGLVRQSGADIARLNLVDFDDRGVLQKRSSTYFQLTDPQVKPKTATTAELKQGHLESTNSNTPQAAVRLVSVMRQFEMLQRALTTGADMNRHVIEDVARVS